VGAAWAAAAVPALPFGRSGSRVRSGYELVRTAGSAGLASGPGGRALVVVTALLPVLAAGALLAASLRRPRAVATLAAMAGLGSGVVGVVALVAPVEAEVGAGLAVVAGAVAVVSAAATLVGRGR
jgi:hypothetical protein